MIEEVISKLDTKGLMVLTILIGKRMLEVLKATELKDTNVTKEVLLTPSTPKIIT